MFPDRDPIGSLSGNIGAPQMPRMVMKVHSAEFKADAVALYLRTSQPTRS